MRLFLAECKKVICSLPFVIFIVILLAFHFTQYGQEVAKVEPPKEGEESYGFTAKKVPEVIIPMALESLQREFEQNTYIAYPFSFYKEVHLTDEQQEKMKNFMGKVHVNMDYGAFEMLMEQADALIGGKSSYAKNALVENFGLVDKTYEDVLAEYELIKQEDQFTNAYARYFADYTGIILLILPIFMIVALSLKDQLAGATDLIYSRNISSRRLVITRYLAVVIMVFLPVLLLAVYETYRVVAMYPGEILDYFAFVKHAFLWLLPTILVVVAFGYFVTEWSGTILAIVLQFALFFMSMSIGMQQMDGGYSLGLIALRHNIIGNTQVYMDHLQALWVNRLSYSMVAIVLLGITIWIYEQKRKGMRTAYEWIKHVLHARRS